MSVLVGACIQGASQWRFDDTTDETLQRLKIVMNPQMNWKMAHLLQNPVKILKLNRKLYHSMSYNLELAKLSANINSTTDGRGHDNTYY